MRFRYLRDPLFLICAALFAVNRFVIEPATDIRFFHSHFNDLICVPFLVPVMLAAARAMGLRRHDGKPLTHEVVVPLLVWSILFEIVFPRHPFWARWVTPDPHDVLCYVIGAAVALTWWNRDRVPHPERPWSVVSSRGCDALTPKGGDLRSR